MPVKIVTETIEKKVKMMTDPTAEFVSLVKHGASRMPFRVIKSHKGGANTSMMLVQSILLPKSIKLEEVSTLKGNEWMAEAVAEKSQDFDGYTKLTQAEAAKFDPSSMKMMALPGGALALVGQLKDGVDPKGMLTISEQVAKDNPMETPLDATVATVTEDVQPYSYDVTFRDLLWREMDAMEGVIFGTLKQAASDPKKRKSTILTAVDNFRSFMAMGLDQISTSAIKMDKDGITKEGESDMFKSKEEFAAAVGAVVDEKLTAFKAEISAKADKPTCDTDKDKDKKKEEEASKDEINISSLIGAAIKEAVAPLVTKIEAVALKQEELGSQLVTEKSEEEEPESKAKSDEEEVGDEGKKSVFSGLLSGGALSKRGLSQVLGGY